MRAFVVRPFDTKEGIDFERVHRELIAPALERLGIAGGAAGELLEAGNIRVDMFQQLVAADLVVVDVSLHNANVFYELGIRHALRNRATFLLRSRADAFPFNLQTDRYLEYDSQHPADRLEKLVQGLRQTLANDRSDSPVHLLLPQLAAVDPSQFVIVPADFAEDVQRARADRSAGDLELFASEIRGLPWEREGLRAIGRAQFELKAHEGARLTWEALRALGQDDPEINSRLGTIYQRLGKLTESDIALRRLTENPRCQGNDLAEALALLARNAKERWRAEWNAAAPADRRASALASPLLFEAAEGYRRAFEADLNHYYSGVNAVALYTVLAELGEALPGVWADTYGNADPPVALEGVGKLREQLAYATRTSIEAARGRAERAGKQDPWIEISAADLRCLSDGAGVAFAYRKALAAASVFDVDAVARQLELYRQLGVLGGALNAALDVVHSLAGPGAPAQPEPQRVLVFTGHRLDAPGRKLPRFPANKEEVARACIRQHVEAERGRGATLGIAGGASGGDILFHEVCAELGIATRLFLALPARQYVAESVADAGPSWVARFWALAEKLETHVLSERKELPDWLAARPDYDIWQRNNLWTLHQTLAAGPQNVTLIALWDGAAQGDGPGGTAHMVREARVSGAKTIEVDTKALFGLG